MISILLALLVAGSTPPPEDVYDARDAMQDTLDTLPADSDEAEALQQRIDDLDAAEEERDTDRQEEILEEDFSVDEPEDLSY